jgi:transposase-like protein
MLPAAFHETEAHANNPIETDHGRLKARLRPMRGLKRDRTARVIVAGHAFIQTFAEASMTSEPRHRSLPASLTRSPSWPS